MKRHFLHLFNNIWFWIGLFFLIRLVGITNPPLEIGHSWRQTTGLMVARNFVEVSPNILYPRIDETGGGAGIIGMEFPLLNYLIYLWSLVFGYSHWAGRLINLTVSSVGIYFFYRIVKRFFSNRVALLAAVVLLSSIWFSFSRKIMPDTFCISLMFIGSWFGLSYLLEGKAYNLILYGVFTALGVLSKIPAGIYLGLFVIPLVAREIPLRRKLVWVVPTAAVLLAVYWWYFIWNVHLSESYGNWYNSGGSIAAGADEILTNFDATLKNFYFNALHSFVFLAVFVAGLVLMVVKKEKYLLVAFFVTLAIFIVYILKSGFYFHHHNYYIIPFVPVMALVCGFALSQIQRQWIVSSILLLGVTEGILNQYHDFSIKPSEMYKLSLPNIADSVSQRNDLIIINGNGNPQQLYLTHRKGWNASDAQIADPEFVESAAKQGAKFLFINKHQLQVELDYPRVYSGPDFNVYEVE